MNLLIATHFLIPKNRKIGTRVNLPAIYTYASHIPIYMYENIAFQKWIIKFNGVGKVIWICSQQWSQHDKTVTTIKHSSIYLYLSIETSGAQVIFVFRNIFVAKADT